MPPEVVRACLRAVLHHQGGRPRHAGSGSRWCTASPSSRRGHVKIYSEVGHGTSIKLYLPRANAGSAAAATSSTLAAAKSGAGGQETILVVEDDAAVRTVAVSALESMGYRVRQAADGREAVQILQKIDEIDLLFTDLVMPNGISGQDLLRMAREQRPGLQGHLHFGLFGEASSTARRRPTAACRCSPSPTASRSCSRSCARCSTARPEARRRQARLIRPPTPVTYPWPRARSRQCPCATPRAAPALA